MRRLPVARHRPKEHFAPSPRRWRFYRSVKTLYGRKLELHASYFDHVMGTSSVREALERGEPAERIVAGFTPGLAEFAKLRGPYLLYR